MASGRPSRLHTEPTPGVVRDRDTPVGIPTFRLAVVGCVAPQAVWVAFVERGRGSGRIEPRRGGEHLARVGPSPPGPADDRQSYRRT